MINLEACPFCKEIPNHQDITTSNEDREGIPAALVCQNCGAQGPWVYLSEYDVNIENYYHVYIEWNRCKKEDSNGSV